MLNTFPNEEFKDVMATLARKMLVLSAMCPKDGLGVVPEGWQKLSKPVKGAGG